MTLIGCIADDFTGATDLASMLVSRGMRTVQTIGVPRVAAAGRRRRRRRRAQVAHDPGRRRGAAIARRARVAARARCRADLLQVLLDLRLDRRGQHRAGRRGAAGRARHRLHDRLPGVAGEPPQRLPGPPVRRRRAAVGFGDAPPSADADDRREPRARAGPADAAQGRAGAVERRAARRVGDPRGLRTAAGGRHAVRRSSMRSRTPTSTRSARPAPTSRSSPAGSGIALGLPANFRKHGLLVDLGRSRAAATRRRRRRGAGGLVLGDDAPRRSPRSRGSARPSRSIRSAASTPDALAARALDAVADDLDAGRPFLVYSSAEPDEDRGHPARARSRRRGRARRARVRARSRARWSSVACAGSSSPAARRRARSCRRSASRRWRSARTIDPGVPWTTSLGEPRLALALKSGNFGGEDFFARSLAMLR